MKEKLFSLFLYFQMFLGTLIVLGLFGNIIYVSICKFLEWIN